jgi:hypothetical protein
MCAVPESSTRPHSDSVHQLGAFRKPTSKFSGLYCCISDDEDGPNSCCGYATKLGVGKVSEADLRFTYGEVEKRYVKGSHLVYGLDTGVHTQLTLSPAGMGMIPTT